MKPVEDLTRASQMLRLTWECVANGSWVSGIIIEGLGLSEGAIGLKSRDFVGRLRMITEAVREYVFNECRSSRNALGSGFLGEHLAVVVEYGGMLAGTLTADLEIVELAAWLHDIAPVQDIAALPRHPGLGVEIARTLLQGNCYPSERVERVSRCILSHSVPVQIGGGAPEDVCLSNADAMSLIARPTYWLYFVFKVRQLGFEEGRAWLLRRVESNWAALIQPARDIIQEEYRRTKALLES